MSSDMEPEYLEVDQPVPGQGFVCLSFVSPEKIFKRKEAFLCKHFIKYFMQRYLLDQQNNPNATPIFRDDVTADVLNSVNTDEWYEDFLYAHEQDLTKKFSQANGDVTSVRALKVRGSYETRQEAEYRAKQLHRRDPNFHVFVGQVGYWLPWDPNPDLIKDQEYLNDQLNTLMKKYMEQREYKDEAFIQDTESRKATAMRDAAKVKAEQMREREEMEKAGKEVGSGKHIDEKEVAKQNIEKLREIADRKDELIEKSKQLDITAKLRKLASGDPEVGTPVAANAAGDQAASAAPDAMGDNSEHSDPWMRSRMARAKEAKEKAAQANQQAEEKMTPAEMEMARRKQMKKMAKDMF